MKRKCFVCLQYGKIETKTLYARFTWWANGVKYLFYWKPWMRIASQCTIDGCQEKSCWTKQVMPAQIFNHDHNTKNPRNWLATQTYFACWYVISSHTHTYTHWINSSIMFCAIYYCLARQYAEFHAADSENVFSHIKLR